MLARPNPRKLHVCLSMCGPSPQAGFGSCRRRSPCPWESDCSVPGALRVLESSLTALVSQLCPGCAVFITDQVAKLCFQGWVERSSLPVDMTRLLLPLALVDHRACLGTLHPSTSPAPQTTPATWQDLHRAHRTRPSGQVAMHKETLRSIK